MKLAALAKKEREDREQRKVAYAKKKNDDGFGGAWKKKPKKMRSMEDWDSFDADAEMDRIEDEDRKSRGLDAREIQNEKILEVMQSQEFSETEKMEKCMHMVGHKEYKHEESEQDVARREAQELIDKIQDPRYQPREKMHYLQETYQKFNGDPNKLANEQNKDVDEAKLLADLQEQMASAQNFSVPDSY